jgi:hypothetical protein
VLVLFRLSINIRPEDVRGAIHLRRYEQTNNKREERDSESNCQVFHAPTIPLIKSGVKDSDRKFFAKAGKFCEKAGKFFAKAKKFSGNFDKLH